MRSLASTGGSIGGGANPPPNGFPWATVERVLGLYREQYFDRKVRHFHDKESAHQIEFSYSWGKPRCREPGWWREPENAECTASGARASVAGHAAAHRWQPASLVAG